MKTYSSVIVVLVLACLNLQAVKQVPTLQELTVQKILTEESEAVESIPSMLESFNSKQAEQAKQVPQVPTLQELTVQKIIHQEDLELIDLPHYLKELGSGLGTEVGQLQPPVKHAFLSTVKDKFSEPWQAVCNLNKQGLELAYLPYYIKDLNIDVAQLLPTVKQAFVDAIKRKFGKQLDALFVQTLAHYEDRELSAVISPDGKYVITKFDTTKTKKIRIADRGTGLELCTFIAPGYFSPAITFSKDSSSMTLLSRDENGKSVLEIRSVLAGRLIFSNTDHMAWAHESLLSIAGNYAFTISKIKDSWELYEVKVWDILTGRYLFKIRGHSFDINSASTDASGRYVVTTGADTTVKVWDTLESKLVHNLTGHTYNVFKVRMSDDGTYIVSGGADGNVKLWSRITGELVHNFAGCYWGDVVRSTQPVPAVPGHRDWLTELVITSDNKYVISGSRDNRVKIWSIETGELLSTLTDHRGWINSVSVNKDNNYLVTSSQDKTVKIWDLEYFTNTISLERLLGTIEQKLGQQSALTSILTQLS